MLHSQLGSCSSCRCDLLKMHSVSQMSIFFNVVNVQYVISATRSIVIKTLKAKNIKSLMGVRSSVGSWEFCFGYAILSNIVQAEIRFHRGAQVLKFYFMLSHVYLNMFI